MSAAMTSRRLVVRNGYHEERAVVTGAGAGCRRLG